MCAPGCACVKMRHHWSKRRKWYGISAFGCNSIKLKLRGTRYTFFPAKKKMYINVTAATRTQIERSMDCVIIVGVLHVSVQFDLAVVVGVIVVAVVVEQNGKFPIGYEIRIGIREHICSRQTLVIVHTTERLNGPSNRSIYLSLSFYRLHSESIQYRAIANQIEAAEGEEER